MSQDTVVTNEKPVSELDKLTTLFNEEIYVRVDASSVPVTKFKILDDMIQQFKASSRLDEAYQKIEEHLKDHPESIFARYMSGIISLIQNKIEDSLHLKTLLEQFKLHSKWTIIEYITDNILQFGEQRLALKFKAEALEKLNKHKELKGVLEKLARHDRKNPEIAKKYALSIIEEDKEKAISYLKQAAESFARSKDYTQLEEIWNILILNNFEDIPFFEKIERILIASREKSRIVILFYPLIETYKQLEDYDKTVYLLKKILDHEPLSQKARNDLIRAYKSKYANHSLLDEFLKMSEIGNSKKSIKACITNFERNIVFDTNNYVLHRNWGVGKIQSISSESDSIVVDFQDKRSHKLSIQMAITSLKPLKKDHIMVKLYESEDEVKELFKNDIPAFMKELLTSSENNTMILADIKAEITSKFLGKNDDWSKWWNKAKVLLKKDPNIGFNPKKKDEIIYRQKPISLTEELSDKFGALTDINKKLDIALEALEVYEEAEGAVESFNQYYYEEEENKDILRRIVAYIYLDMACDKIGSDDIPRHQKPEEIKRLIQSLTKDELLTYSKSLTNVEVKKSYVKLIKKYHPDYTNIFVSILFEVPVKINKYVFGILVDENKFAELNMFIEAIMQKSKEFPEIFLWISKSILSGSWAYPWLNVSTKDLTLRTFRLLKPLGKIEEKGTKLKNLAHEILFGNDNAVITDLIKTTEQDFIRKVYALYKEVPYITDTEKEGLLNLINKLKPDFSWEDKFAGIDEEEPEVVTNIANQIIVTEKAYNAKKEEFNHLVNVEMAENSKDIGEAQEKGDLRENAEYKAAMEKQSQLQAQIKKLDADIKNAKILDLSTVKTDRINIGCTVRLKNNSTGEEFTYSILGPWDADTENNIISYQSPMGKSLLGKKIEDSASVDFDGNHAVFNVLEIRRFSRN